MLGAVVGLIGTLMLKLIVSFFLTLVTGPRRSLSLKLSDTRVYEPQIRARLGTTAHLGAVVGLVGTLMLKLIVRPFFFFFITLKPRVE